MELNGGSVSIDVNQLLHLCAPIDGSKRINQETFTKVVGYFATGVRATVQDARDATGVLIGHVGLIVNRLTDAGYLRVWRGYGGKHDSRRNQFLLIATPEYEPLYRKEDGPRPEHLSYVDFPRWGDDIGPLVECFGGYTRRLK